MERSVMASPKKKPPEPPPFHPEPSLAEQAFLALEAELMAQRDPAMTRVAIDVQRASAVAHSVVVRDEALERAAMFARLEKVDLYDMATLERVRQCALATWFARQRQLGKLALSSTASVDPAVIDEARLRRARMLRVLDHWFFDDAGMKAELTMIRAGSGHQDLANDLEALADVYRRPEVHEVIRHDRKHFMEDEVAWARRLAQAIFESLGVSRETDAKRWRVLCQRAWAMLLREYEEHRAAGAFLFRKLEDVGESYPSLFTAVRAAPVRGSGGGGGGEEGGDGSEEPLGEGPG
jgi:hypothetical protein